jgi:hypothetical protein
MALAAVVDNPKGSCQMIDSFWRSTSFIGRMQKVDVEEITLGSVLFTEVDLIAYRLSVRRTAWIVLKTIQIQEEAMLVIILIVLIIAIGGGGYYRALVITAAGLLILF